MQGEAEDLSLFRRVWPGALVGAWVGYFASQVTHSDWEDSNIGRAAWTASGATLGAAVTLSLGLGDFGRPGRSEPGVITPGPNVLLPDEIATRRAPNAYDLIRNLRPAWFVVRGTASFREGARGEISLEGVGYIEEGIDQIVVYMDEVQLGGLDELRGLPIESFLWARFLSAAQATSRWGGGHAHGAIQLLTSIPNTR